MAPISKRKIKQEVFSKIQRHFAGTVASLRGTVSGQEFVGEFFTSMEQVMFAKRLAIIFMLLEGATAFRIHKTLSVSTSTVFRFQRRLEEGDFIHIKRCFRKKQARKQFWKDLEVLVRVGMPPYASGRWKWLYEMDNKYKT